MKYRVGRKQKLAILDETGYEVALFNKGCEDLAKRTCDLLNQGQTLPIADVVVCSAFSDAELEDMMNTWFDHYQANGESHYSDTPDFRIREIYWDKVVDRVIEDVNTEMTDEEVERFCGRLADL